MHKKKLSFNYQFEVFLQVCEFYSSITLDPFMFGHVFTFDS